MNVVEPLRITASVGTLSSPVRQRLRLEQDSLSEKLRCANPATARELLHGLLPRLVQGAVSVRQLLAARHQVVLVSGLWFLTEEPWLRDVLVLGFSACLGRPQSADAVSGRLL